MRPASETAMADRRTAWLLFGLALCLTFAFSLSPRIAQLRRWAANPEQYYAQNVPVSGADSYYWFRMAREYREGRIERGARDPLRKYPDGFEYGGVPAFARVIGELSRLFGDDVYRAGIFLTLVLSSLFVLPLGFFCLRLGHPAAGVLGALVGSFSPAFFYRSSIRHTDTDGGNLFFVWLIGASMAWISPEARWSRNLGLAALAGLSVTAFCWWYDQRGFWLVYLVAFAAYLAASRFGARRKLALLAVFFALSNPLNLAGAVSNVRGLAAEYIFTTETVAGSGGDPSRGALAFPNVTREIDELERLPPRRTLEGIVRNAFVSALGLAGFALLAGLHWRRLIPALPIAALGCLGLLRSYRFAMYLAPLAGIGLGYLLGVAIRGLAKRAGGPAPVGSGRPRGRAALVEMLVYVVAFALVAFNLDLSAYHSKRRSWMPQDLLASLLDLRAVLPPGAAVWTSWSFGYAVSDVARAATFDDPGAPDAVLAQLMSRSMVTADPTELAEIVSFVANRGRRGLEDLLSQSASYAELLERVARDYEPVRGEIYLLFSEPMIREYGHYYYKGNWDFDAREGTFDGYDVRRCQDTRAYEMVCAKAGQPDALIDLNRGLIAERFFARKALFVEDGKVVSEIDYPHEEGIFVQVIDARDDAPYSVHFLDEPVFRSNFNQMFVLGRFDPDLYTEVYSAVPAARAFRLNPVARPDSERTGR